MAASAIRASHQIAFGRNAPAIKGGCKARAAQGQLIAHHLIWVILALIHYDPRCRAQPASARSVSTRGFYGLSR
jgi:hypothetical protein